MSTAVPRKKILFFAHSEDRHPGTTVEFLNQNNYEFEIHHLGGKKPMPKLEEYQGLIVLGGEQNVDEEHLHPWLKEEKEAIRRYLELDRPLLGICLGGQLIAQILGADVRRHVCHEVGWKKVRIMPEASSLIPQELSELQFFQWHAYRFITPVGAKKFATNDITADQGFVYRDNVIGVQFHPEASESWVRECSEDTTYPQGQFVQDQAELRSQIHLVAPMKAWYFQLLNRLFSKA